MDRELFLGGTSLSDEFECDLGDARRTKRLKRFAEAMAQRPETSLPHMMEPAALEGAYRLLRNENLTLNSVLSGHIDNTRERIAALGKDVLVLHDTTTFSFKRRQGYMRHHLNPHGTNSQGFFAHLSLVATDDGLRAPIGVLSCHCYVHKSQVSEETQAFWQQHFRDYESEAERWIGNMKECAERAEAADRLIHVCDRESDRADVMDWMAREGGRFVIRSYKAWKTPEGVLLKDALANEPLLATRIIELSARSLQGKPKRSKTFPERPARQASIGIRAARLDLTLAGQTHALNVVEAIEHNPPEGQAPVHWLLLTSEAIDTANDALRVVDIYRSRWLIEEYFKAIKTGCAYEKRQLDSAATLLVALALTLPVAWHLLALRHLAKHHADVPATAFVTELQLLMLRRHQRTRRVQWSEEPTIGEACRAIALLGGHLRSNGPPGWQTLARGYHDLLQLALGAQLASVTHEM